MISTNSGAIMKDSREECERSNGKSESSETNSINAGTSSNSNLKISDKSSESSETTSANSEASSTNSEASSKSSATTSKSSATNSKNSRANSINSENSETDSESSDDENVPIEQQTNKQPQQIEPQQKQTEQQKNNKKSRKIDMKSLPSSFYVHPLKNCWSLFYLESGDQPREERLHKITRIDTLEDFWSIYKHIAPASELTCGYDYNLFRQGKRPMWEDNANKNGGRWILLIKKNLTTNIDNLWLKTLLCMINENLEYSEQVHGASVHIRFMTSKIGLWISVGKNVDKIRKIGQSFLNCLGIEETNASFRYEQHEDSSTARAPRDIKKYTLDALKNSTIL